MVSSRREFLADVGGLGVSGLLPATTARAADPPRPRALPGVITRQKNPDNVEFPFWTLDQFLTPNEQFYVRTHFEVPKLDRKHWKLKIEGAVEKPLEIGYDDLLKMPAHTLPALLECSGNSRVFLKPPQSSIRWELGAVSVAEWTGVRLADVLDRAGVKPGAIEVLLEGADRGAFGNPFPATPGVILYSRSLPMAKARRPEVLLVYKMNGEDLPPAHGHPLRAVVAGWYGMASVKWLTRIAVLDQPFHGYFQTFMYTFWQRTHGQPTLVPTSSIPVKSEIARPMEGEVVPLGKAYRVFGAAWAGESDVVQVEFSADGGKTWTAAKLTGENKPFCWRFWEYEWTPSAAGKMVLMSRATDSKGRTQPLERDHDRRDGIVTHTLPIAVEVR